MSEVKNMDNFFLQEEMKRLLQLYPDPRKGLMGKIEFEANNPDSRKRFYRPVPGIIADINDPLKLGRVRVASDMINPGALTPFIPVVSFYSGKKQGHWCLPQPGQPCILGFIGYGKSKPFVLGYFFSKAFKPPKHTTENPSKSVVYQSKNHRIEFIDEEGKEGIIVSTAKGQMRMTLTKEKGFELVNELGAINISCRKLTLKGGDSVSLIARKNMEIHVKGKAVIHTKKAAKIISDKDITLNGNNVKIDASRGVTAGGKQIAVMQSQVAGFDIHMMQIPAGITTAVVPLPHPFLGKIVDGVSQNVKIGGYGAATKGSIAQHDNPMHMQLPGTINFVNPPTKRGEVTGGTSPKTKINGKEAAVVGSTVSTCNDLGLRDNSAILAPGASMPMPVIINPKNMEEYRLEQAEQETKHPAVTSARWGKSTIKEGEKAELIAHVKDIADGNMLTMQIFVQGQDPSSGAAIAQIHAAVDGGSAIGEWTYPPRNANEVPPEEDPQYVFSVHSAWCNYEMSGGAVTVELKRPEITEVKWLDNEDSDTEENVLGEIAKLKAETQDVDDGKSVVFDIFPEGSDTENDKPIKTLDAPVKDNAAVVEFNFKLLEKLAPIDEVMYRRYKKQGIEIPRDQFQFYLDDYEKEVESEVTEKPKYIFKAKAPRCTEVTSGAIEVSKTIEVIYTDALGNPVKDVTVKVKESGGTEHEITTDDEGKFELASLIPTRNYFSYELPENTEEGA